MAGTVSFLTISQLGFSLYDRVNKAESDVAVEVFASPYVTPEGFVLAELAHLKPRADAPVADRDAERTVTRIVESQSMVTFVVKNEGMLPAERVALSLSGTDFSLASAEDESGQTKVWREPRVIDLSTIRAKQTTIVRAWSIAPWQELSPEFLSRRVSVTHDAGVGRVELTGGNWAKSIRQEDGARKRLPLLIALALLTGLGALVSSNLRKRQQQRLAQLMRSRHIDGGGA